MLKALSLMRCQGLALIAAPDLRNLIPAPKTRAILRLFLHAGVVATNGGWRKRGSGDRSGPKALSVDGV